MSSANAVESSSLLPGKEDNEELQASSSTTWCQSLVAFYRRNEFVLLVLLSILLAKAYPPLGATYLLPRFTATWGAVVFIFLVAGLGLKTEDFKNVVTHEPWFHVTVQLYNFAFVSGVVYLATRLLLVIPGDLIPLALANGMIMCACVTLTINAVLVLAKAAGGDDGAAIFNSAVGNLMGVFVSPALIWVYVGTAKAPSDEHLEGIQQEQELNPSATLYKLLLRVVVPILAGQVLQQRFPTFVSDHKQFFKKAQVYALVYIVYTVFCRTFLTSKAGSMANITVATVLVLFVCQLLLLVFVMIVAWYLVLPFVCLGERPLQVTGLFCCSHKSVAMGIPLLNAIYPGDPSLGLYTLPLLMWHPMQLIIGSAMSPRLNEYVQEGEDGLAARDCDLLGSLQDISVKRSRSDSIRGSFSNIDSNSSGALNSRWRNRRSSVHESMSEDF